jgi:hypothetical protein
LDLDKVRHFQDFINLGIAVPDAFLAYRNLFQHEFVHPLANFEVHPTAK